LVLDHDAASGSCSLGAGFELVVELLLRQVQLNNLRPNNLLEVKTISNFILNLVLYDRQHILHIHYSVIKGQTQTQGRVGLRVVLQGCRLELLLLRFGQALNLIMINLLLDLNEEFLLVFDLVLFKVFHFLLHFRDWVTAGSQYETSFFLLLGGLDVSWNGIAEHFMIYFALSTLGLSVEVFVQLQRTKGHIVPKLRILP